MPINIRGVPIGTPVVSADGTRVYQASSVTGGTGANSTYVTVIDTAHDSVVGKPIRLDGWAAGSPVVSADGHYVYQATNTSVGGVSTTTVTAIDSQRGRHGRTSADVAGHHHRLDRSRTRTALGYPWRSNQARRPTSL